MTKLPNAQQRRETYIAKAKEAEGMAHETDDANARKLILQIAQSWRLLAGGMSREPPN